MTEKHFPTKDELYELYITQNKTMRDIAKLYNTTSNAVEHWIQRAGFKKKIAAPISKEVLEELYKNQKKSSTEISILLNEPVGKVKKYLEKYGCYTRYIKGDYARTKTKTDISKEELYELFIIQNKTLDELTKILDKSRSQVRRYLRFYDIKKPKEKWIKSQRKAIRNRFKCSTSKLLEVQEKINSSKTKNNSWSMSKPEMYIRYFLSNIFSEVKYQYRSMKYPFNCDFYIPEIDLYIEYQGDSSHGKEPYNRSNYKHKKIIKECKRLARKNLIETGKISRYQVYINVWTVRDPLKRETARKNNLNWIEFFNMKQFFEWFKKQTGTPLLEYKSSIN